LKLGNEATLTLSSVSFQPHLLRGHWLSIVQAIKKREALLDELRDMVVGREARNIVEFDDVHELDNCPTDSSGDEDETED